MDSTIRKKENGFKVKAGTFTLKKKDSEYQALLADDRNYEIPIYQRPYSWGEEQLRKFISDLAHSFSGEEGEFSEPVFIGTMQLSKPEKVENGVYKYDVIDGQQRLTTILLLLKIIDEVLGKNKNLDWLKSRVSNKEQQKLLNEFLLSSISLLHEKSPNIYIRNAFYLYDVLKEKFSDEHKFDLNQMRLFKAFIEESIYFVVIETHAGLAQTLKIFDSINTTGLDLNGGDIFKIKLYEYLTEIKKKDESIFNEISKVYERIDQYNASDNGHQININAVLDIYRHILIGRHNLRKVLMTEMSATLFFERLFDTKLGVYEWKNFNEADKVELSVDDLNDILDALEHYNGFNYTNQINASCVRFLYETRYRRYWLLAVILLYRFKGFDELEPSLEKFNKELFKLFFLYSTAFAKRINDIDHFIYTEVLTAIFDERASIEKVTAKIKVKKEGPVQHYAYPKGLDVLNRKLEQPITDNSNKKNLICRLSAVLEQHNEKDPFNPEILDAVFDWDFDIEHIQSYHDQNEAERDKIWDDWKEEINSIGNLVILERKYNRSIGNKSYQNKLKKYKESKYQIVRKLVESNPENWNKESAVKRRARETKKIADFIFD